MATKGDIALMSHLMRRAGFGATRTEIEGLVEQGYEETVEQLLHPEEHPDIDEALFYRYHPMAEMVHGVIPAQVDWLYRMVNTERPLREKVALFWHQVFATGSDKVESGYEMHAQVQMFREHGMGNYRDLLVRLAQNPAMIYWLDNHENHKRAPNENWGRELLELFSMGVGNYSEKDVYECSRAFTGWTFTGKVAIQLGPIPWRFEYRSEDHDFNEKTFLGHTGRFNGQDIIDIIVQQPACHRFISRHLYNFFVADEPPVPAWPTEEPQDPAAIDLLARTFVESGLEMRPVLRALFNSDFFKEAMYRKVKSPVEIVVGTLRLTGDLNGPDPRWGELPPEITYMGQDLQNPPSVEGWHTGEEWINSGALMNRVNFVAERIGNTGLPGVQEIIRRVASNGTALTAETLVNRCLDLMGPLDVEDQTRKELVDQAASEGPISWASDDEFLRLSSRVTDVLALIVATREYHFG
jgi:uncharacterized protein (DUF1800 family)